MALIKMSSLSKTVYLFIIPYINFKVSWILLLGYFCYGLSFLIFSFIITKYRLGLMVPILSGILNIVILIFAVVLFHEKFSWNMMVGVILVAFGIIIMNVK